jgi:hypothetical protein
MELKTRATVDGEIVALDDTGHPRFKWLIIEGLDRELSFLTLSIF